MALAPSAQLLRLKTSAALFDDVARPERAGRAAVADLQRPAADRRRPGVGVGAGQHGHSRASLIDLPVPLITLATVIALLRLKSATPLLTTAPVPSVPVVPPLPICSVPALIVVVPA